MEVSDQLQEVLRIRSEVERLQLDGCDKVLTRPIALLSKIYNGTGPEFMPNGARVALDRIAAPFLPAVMIHDDDFEDSDGTVGSFVVANNRLLSNCIICANDAAPWYSWKRYALYAEAWTIYRACEKFGWMAWLSACYKNTQNTKE